MTKNGRLWLIGAIVAVVVAIGAVLLFANGSDDEPADGTTTIAPDDETTTTSADDETTTSTADETTTSEANETTITAEEDTTTSEPIEDDEDTLNAITVEIDGEFIVFTENLECTLGPDYAGSITADADDGTTFEAVLDGTASKVAIDGPSGTYDAEVTNLSNSPTILTILAAPPEMEVSVVLGFCDETS